MKTEEEIRARIVLLENAHTECEECAIEGGYDDEEYLDEGEQAELAALKWVVCDADY